MKKLATLLLAAGMVLGSLTGAQAIDWKVKGTWQFEFGYYDIGNAFNRNVNGRVPGVGRAERYGTSATANGDNFAAGQRTNIQVDAVASESLSGTLFFEMGQYLWGKGLGDPNWGDKTRGGALGQRSGGVAVRQAYIDWIMPNTDLRVRMGIQRLDTPSFTFGVNVFHEDVAAVVLNYKFNDNVSLTAFWARPYNDNFAGDGRDQAASLDNVDSFGVVLPLTFDGFKVTPWGLVGAIGPNTFRGVTANAAGNNAPVWGQRVNHVVAGMTPYYWDTHNRRAGWRGSRQYATAWWAGLTGEITAADPFRFAWDATYGSVSYPDAGYMDRHGWYINVLAEYKLDWGVPGLYAWWASGDNGNPRDGSERMPVFVAATPDNMLSTFGHTGSPAVGSPDGAMGNSSYTGTWGIGARIRDMSFLEDLKHTLRVNFFGGTNDPQMAKYMLGKKTIGGIGNIRSANNSDFNTGGGAAPYLTSRDYGLEINFDTVYKIYENLELFVELGYIHLWLDQSRSVWGGAPANYYYAGQPAIRGVSVTDGIKAAMYIKYSF